MISIAWDTNKMIICVSKRILHTTIRGFYHAKFSITYTFFGGGQISITNTNEHYFWLSSGTWKGSLSPAVWDRGVYIVAFVCLPLLQTSTIDDSSQYITILSSSNMSKEYDMHVIVCVFVEVGKPNQIKR